MNYIHFSPHFPPNFYQFSMSLKRAGSQVLGLGNIPWDQLRPELKDSLTEYYRVSDLHNNDQLAAAIHHFIDRYGSISGIDSHNEYWLEKEAMLRSRFDIDGLKPEQMENFRKKSEMKKIFRQAGLKVATGKVIYNLAEALDLIRYTGYPIIAKPDKGVGAADTFKIRNEPELMDFFKVKPPVDYILEEFIDGDIISFDGLTGKAGELIFFTAMQNEKGVMEVVHQDSHVYYFTLRDIPLDLEEAGRKVLTAFDVKGRFFHFEFFREHSSGELVALEVNLRPPGGFSTDMFNYSCDIDVYQTWAEMAINNKSNLFFKRKYHICFVSRKFHYNYAYPHEKVMELFPENIAFYGRIDDVLSRAMGNSCYLVRSEHLEQMFDIQQAIHKLNDSI